jgi:hypothetical protein
MLNVGLIAAVILRLPAYFPGRQVVAILWALSEISFAA